VSYKSSIICDVEFGLCLSVRDVVFHPSRCELTVVRINDVVRVRVGIVKMVNTVMVCGCLNLLRTES
jgi:hypothetical protein